MSPLLDINTELLEKTSVAAFTTAGVPQYLAKSIVSILLQNDFDGYTSHGIMRLVDYINDIKSGIIDPNKSPLLEKKSSFFSVIDGQNCLGICVIEIMRELAISQSIGDIHFVSISNAHHLGRLATLAKIFTDEGYLIQGFANYNGWGQKVALPGGGPGKIATNPIVYGIPRGKDSALILDMTTSVTSEGAVRQFFLKGESVPNGWLVDDAGNSVQDPSVFYQNPMQAYLCLLGGDVAGHKGFGLALIAEIFASLNEGAGNISTPAKHGGNSCFFMMFKPSVLGLTPDYFQHHIEKLILHLAPKQGVLRIPGSNRSEWSPTIRLTQKMWETICGIASSSNTF